MNVHIVWITPMGDRIIDRLARMLAEQTGWSLSDRPREGADINYSMLYADFAQRFTDWRRTRWAAYFSHYEADTPYKRFWWESADPLVEIKTVSAAQYGDMLQGKVVQVTPPVEPRFEIRERRPNGTFTIGVSGFVDRSGRKGEGMVARLASDLDGRADVVCSGQGWPARCVNRSLEGLVEFYNALDVYLCTSTVEGIPIPPLEALACGVPVVIPNGVGMLDDLADIPGIWRYDAGDYGDLLATMDFITTARPAVDREQLRASVADYTPQAWARSHEAGFRSALGLAAPNGRGRLRPRPRSLSPDASPREVPVEQKEGSGKRGLYLVAYGTPARRCALGAIESFKRHFADIPVALAGSEPLGPEDIFIEHPDEDIGGRAAKVKIFDLAPSDWQYVVYTDVDVEFIARNDLLWRMVEDGWDMAICKNPGRFHIAREMSRPDNRDECEATFRQIGTDEVIQLNGGAFGFQRNERTRDFFHAWEQEWRRWGKRDQAALLRALWQRPVRLWVLGNEWNTITRYDSPDRAAWMLHYPLTARRWRGVVHYRLDDPQAWRAVKEFEKSAK